MQRSAKASIPILVLLCIAISGCATHLDRLRPVRDQFYHGQLDSARTAILKEEKHRGDRDVLVLDQAMVELAAGHPKEAEKLLRGVRDRFDHLEQKSLAEDAASLAADDTIRSYAGEDYERVLIRVMLALSNLMADGGDANAYALQITEKQQDISDRLAKSKNVDVALRDEAYKQVALGPYIRAMIAEESPLTLDDAVRARVQVANFAPNFRDSKTDLQRAQHEVPIPPGHGVLYVFALVGRGPYKEEVHEVATQAALLVADRIISANADKGLPPTLAPVPIPAVRTQLPVAESIAIRVDAQPVGQTATIVDIGGMAAMQQEARYPEIIGRAVARRVLKKGAIYAVKEGVDAGPWTPASIALNLVGIAWEASERADLRCWGLLPDRIQVLRVTLPAGEHEITLQAADRFAAFGAPASKRVTIRDGHNTYMLGQFPDSQLVGEILTNGAE